MRNALSALLFLVAAPLVAAGLQPKTVYVFKNGVAFVVEQGTPAVNDRTVELAAPDALFGSVWLRAAGRSDAIAGVTARKVGVERPHAAASLAELLRANAGKNVTITIDDREVTGKVLASPAWEVKEDGVDRPVITSSPLLFLAVGNDVKAFDMGNVRAVSFAGAPVTEVSGQREERRLAIRLRDAAAVPLTLSYLRRDLGWTPEYELRLRSDTAAELSMQAELVNDATDLRGAEVFFVVGVPNFRFDRVWSPIALRETLEQFFSSLGRRSDESYAMSNMLSQSAMTNVSSDNGLGPTSTALAGSTEEDLFVYRQPAVTLLKGERGAYPVFSASVPLRHLYRWSIPDSAPDDRSRSYPQTIEAPAERVWHVVRVTNMTPVPWTTGSVLVMSGEMPLAGSVLEYTAKSGTAEVRLTAAPDIAVDREELESGRKPGARRFHGDSYDAVTIEGTLRVRNFKDKPVALAITKSLTGEVVDATDGGKGVALATLRGAVNPSSKIDWEIQLGAGESKTIRYHYTIYVRG